MVKYLCDPQPDATVVELRRIFRCNPGYMLWRQDEIPEGCERHFRPIEVPEDEDEHGPGGHVAGCSLKA